jgi:hypothetical protein
LFGRIAAIEILVAEGQTAVFFFDHFKRFPLCMVLLLPLVFDDAAHTAPLARLDDIKIVV